MPAAATVPVARVAIAVRAGISRPRLKGAAGLGTGARPDDDVTLIFNSTQRAGRTSPGPLCLCAPSNWKTVDVHSPFSSGFVESPAVTFAVQISRVCHHYRVPDPTPRDETPRDPSDARTWRDRTEDAGRARETLRRDDARLREQVDRLRRERDAARRRSAGGAPCGSPEAGSQATRTHVGARGWPERASARAAAHRRTPRRVAADGRSGVPGAGDRDRCRHPVSRGVPGCTRGGPRLSGAHRAVSGLWAARGRPVAMVVGLRDADDHGRSHSTWPRRRRGGRRPRGELRGRARGGRLNPVSTIRAGRASDASGAVCSDGVGTPRRAWGAPAASPMSSGSTATCCANSTRSGHACVTRRSPRPTERILASVLRTAQQRQLNPPRRPRRASPRPLPAGRDRADPLTNLRCDPAAIDVYCTVGKPVANRPASYFQRRASRGGST